ncbi:MAG TPA: hypothetical protein VKO61_00040 [Candidatus Paceibacterota bacterium]|nr:hypothetical protein [Candidatus Paceibacterota bacterium]
MNFEERLKEINKLNLPSDSYAIFGSGPMAIREIREARDIDIFVTNKAYDRLAKKFPEKEAGYIELDGVEIYSLDNSLFENPKKVLERSENIKGYKFVTLEDLVHWKKEYGREKDLKDVELINNYLNK